MAKKKELKVTNEELKLSKEELQAIKITHLEVELVKKDIQAIVAKIETLEREKMLLNLKTSDLKNELSRKQRENAELISEIGRKLGVNLKDAIINEVSGEISFV